MSLTDDWKAGKLKNGWYFVKTVHGFIQPMYYLVTRVNGELVKGFAEEPEDRVVEALAPCNYDELQRLKEKLDEALKSSAEFEMKAYDLERDLKSAKSHNRYYLKAIKDMTAVLDYMTDENEKCETKIKKLEQENKQHKENCCCLENEKLRLDMANLRELLKECIPYMDISLIARSEEAKNLLIRINAAIGESEGPDETC